MLGSRVRPIARKTPTSSEQRQRDAEQQKPPPAAAWPWLAASSGPRGGGARRQPRRARGADPQAPVGEREQAGQRHDPGPAPDPQDQRIVVEAHGRSRRRRPGRPARSRGRARGWCRCRPRSSACARPGRSASPSAATVTGWPSRLTVKVRALGGVVRALRLGDAVEADLVAGELGASRPGCITRMRSIWPALWTVMPRISTPRPTCARVIAQAERGSPRARCAAAPDRAAARSPCAAPAR